ncbi:MAG: hypothetical protein IPI93_01015 [Sphingobacteriaceae bacterium]|nr:hypothetical protein [Sphingobacteriaceae bacterium]
MNKTASVIKLLAALICASGIFFTACKKEEIQGPKGDPGTNGIGGNATIVSTNTFIVNTSSWVADTSAECLKVTISFPSLTQTVVDKGGVKVYRQTGTVWSELPITTTDLFTQFGFDVGNLYLNYINIEGGLPGTPPPTERYRMVIVSEAQKNSNPFSNNGAQIENVRAIVK